jgi:uncharacterized protein YbjT (DUF2867 family)
VQAAGSGGTVVVMAPTDAATEPSPTAEHSRLVLVAGATGYLGRRLVGELIGAGHRVRCLARTPAKLDGEVWRPQVEVVAGDVLDPASLGEAFSGVHAAYYLVHSIGGDGDWQDRDRRAAANVAAAAQAAGTAQIIYLGGLGDEAGGDLSPHLRSRHEVGEVLASGTVPVTELRAAVVIGSGSASFEMLRHLVETLPAMVTPRWVDTRCQPIAVRDVLAYLLGVLDNPEALGRILEIGGADVLTYREMMRVYAEVAGLPRRLIVPVPVLSPSLSSHWIGLVTPLPADLARPLVDSLVNEVVVRDHAIDDVVDHQPLGYRRAVELALRRVEDLDVTTTWADAELFGRSPADALPADPDWAGGIVLEDRQTIEVAAAPEAVFAVAEGIGGDRGWFASAWLWRLRGWMDLISGGIGMRRGRRHPDELRVGDALDFWRVEALDRPHLLRLRAEMRLPGDAWLEWRVSPTGNGTRLEQRARFHPRGLLGRAYWYLLLPFHRFVFHPMAREIAAHAEAAARRAVPRVEP